MESIVLASAGRDAETVFSGGGDLTVVAAFARSFYMRDAGGRLACVGGPGLGDGPLNALCEHAPAIPAAGAILSTGIFDRRRMTRWRPAPPGALKREGLRARLAAVAAARPRGLAAAIPALLGSPFESADPFVAAAVTPLLEIRDWTGGDPPEALSRLVGLGSGLTPAGDDAIGGAAIAFRATGRTAQADALADWIRRLAPDATGEIARAHLMATARGEGSAALHAALGALMTGGEPDLAAIDAIGHSSGWDALAGAVAVLAQA
ncbi:MAG: DUF2877 domain-containing protein [Rhodospirillales bacterium]|nr:DUF2877 domain-containing protein [Rhodospirillales bacterium]